MSMTELEYSLEEVVLTPADKKRINAGAAKYSQYLRRKYHAAAAKYKQELKNAALKKSKSKTLTDAQVAEIERKVQQFRNAQKEELAIQKREYISIMGSHTLMMKEEQAYIQAKDRQIAEQEERMLNQHSVIDTFLTGIDNIRLRLTRNKRNKTMPTGRTARE